jgi:hypothetical protein
MRSLVLVGSTVLGLEADDRQLYCGGTIVLTSTMSAEMVKVDGKLITGDRDITVTHEPKTGHRFNVGC